MCSQGCQLIGKKEWGVDLPEVRLAGTVGRQCSQAFMSPREPDDTRAPSGHVATKVGDVMQDGYNWRC